MGALRHGKHCQRIIVDIGVVVAHLHFDRLVFLGRHVVIDRLRRVVDRRHRHLHVTFDRGLAVGHGVLEAGVAVVVRRRGEVHLAVAAQRDRALAGQLHRAAHRDGLAVDVRDRQRVAVGVRVVGQQVDHREGVFRRGGFIGHGHGRVAQRVDRQRHAGLVSRAAGVLDGVGEAGIAVVVGRRIEGQRAVGVQRDRALAGQRHRAAGHDVLAVDLGDRQLVAIDILVVLEHIDDHRAVFGCAHRVVHGLGRIVGGTHRDGGRGRRAVRGAIRHGDRDDAVHGGRRVRAVGKADLSDRGLVVGLGGVAHQRDLAVGHGGGDAGGQRAHHAQDVARLRIAQLDGGALEDGAVEVGDAHIGIGDGDRRTVLGVDGLVAGARRAGRVVLVQVDDGRAVVVGDGARAGHHGVVADLVTQRLPRQGQRFGAFGQRVVQGLHADQDGVHRRTGRAGHQFHGEGTIGP